MRTFVHRLLIALLCAVVAEQTLGLSRSESQSVAAAEQLFFDDLACRTQELSLSPSARGALIDDSLDGNRSLRFFLNADDLLHRRFLPSVSYFSARNLQQLYWTRSDDLIISEIVEFTHVTFSKGGIGRIKRITTQPFWPAVLRDADLAPSFIGDGSVFVAGFGATPGVLEFRPASDSIRATDMNFDDADAFLWDADANFLRMKNGDFQYYASSRHVWLKSDLPALPIGARPIYLRGSPAGGVEVAALIGEADDGQQAIVAARSGDTTPRTLAVGQIFQLLMSPSGNEVYGYLEPSGRFVHLADKNRPIEEERWLDSFAGKDELRSIAFVDRGKLAIVKLMSTSAAQHFDVLDRDNKGQVRRRPLTCGNVARGVRSVVSDKHNVFFSSDRTGSLVVYVHGGPNNYVGRGGNWITDVFTAAGYPVVAINYAGSAGRAPSERELGDLASSFSADISDGVSLAESTTHGLSKRLIVVTDSFGALGVFAAISKGNLHPDVVIVLDGLVSVSPLLSQGSPSDKVLGRFLRQTQIDLQPLITPARLAAASPTTYFDFIHGENDSTAPLSDVEMFVAALRSLHLEHQPRLVLVPRMYHKPTTRSDFQSILKEIYAVLPPK